MFEFSAQSKANLAKCHPSLQAVAYRALELSEIDFAISETERSKMRQRTLIASGASTTMNSRHLRRPIDIVGVHALDIVALHPQSKATTWEQQYYKQIAKAFFKAAIEFQVQIEWGGFWNSLDDLAHFQLSWEDYP